MTPSRHPEVRPEKNIPAATTAKHPTTSTFQHASMYDKKTWVILTICGALLVTNFYYMNKNQQIEAARLAAEQKLQATVEPGKDPAAVTTAELTVEPPPPPTDEELKVLENDKIAFTLTNIGGGVKYAEFKTEFEVGSKTARVKANRFGSGPIGALAGAGENLENVPYAYKAEESVEGKKAVYIAKLPSGLIAKKTFSLMEGSEPGAPYLLNFDLQLENAAATTLNINQWSIFIGESTANNQREVGYTSFFWRNSGSTHFKASTTFKKGMMSAAQVRQTSPADDKIEYAGVTNQFFATVLRPKDPAITSMWAKPSDVVLPESNTPETSVRAGLQLPSTTLNPHEPKTFSYLLFVGPKHNNMLQKMDNHWGDGWGNVIDYGWFWWVSRPLNWVLNTYHHLLDGVAKNWAWGLAIIFLTLTVRICIWPLHAKSTHTMKRMSKLQPEMAKIKEKYSDDPNKLNTEMMGLYKTYGINPLGGCLPMFIQIPIFYGFFSMLRYAVELRGHGFLWIHDLSQPDTLYTFHLPFELPIFGNVIPINILPVVMAITSFLQIQMTPKTGDKMQQNMIKFMPFMFFFFCYNYASALALYWTTQNIFSIGQTWLMNKIPEPELKARPVSGKKSWVQRAAERQQQIQRERKDSQGMKDVTPDKKKRPPRTGG
ncbi:MAG: membrane protein insertase YidC [Luteolibacter sp.]